MTDNKKRAMSEAAKEHIREIGKACGDLTKRYEGSKLEINQCCISEDGTWAEFEYIPGVTLEEILDSFLEKEDWDGFYGLL